MLGTRSVRGNERQVYLGLLIGGKLAFCLFRGFLHPLQRHLVFSQIYPVLLIELLGDPVNDLLVEIVASEMGIAVSGLDLENPVAHIEYGYIESSAAEIKYGDLLVLFAVEPVREACRRRLVYYTKYFEPGDLSGVLGCLSLGVIKIRRYGYYRLSHLFTQIIFRRLFHFLKYHGRYLRRRVLLVLGYHDYVAVGAVGDLVRHKCFLFLDLGVFPAHKPLYTENSVIRICHGLALRRLSHQLFPAFGESNYARCSPCSLGILNDLGLFSFHYRHTRVRCP